MGHFFFKEKIVTLNNIFKDFLEYNKKQNKTKQNTSLKNPNKPKYFNHVKSISTFFKSAYFRA